MEHISFQFLRRYANDKAMLDMPTGRRKIDFEDVAWYASRALYGQTPAPVRAYSFQHDVDVEIFILKAEVDRELTEDEREDLAVVDSEITADMFSDNIFFIRTVVVLVPVGEPLDPGRDGIVYLRDGEHVPPGYAGLPPAPALASFFQDKWILKASP